MADPEAINLRFISRARIGVLFSVLVATWLVLIRGDVRHVPYQEKTLIESVIRVLMIGGVFVLAGRELREALLGLFDLTRMILVGILFGAAGTLVGICLLILAHWRFGHYSLALLIPAGLWAASITLLLFGWLQTRLAQWMPPLVAAVVVSCSFALSEFLTTRSWILTAAYIGYYSLPFLRWKTGSLGACAIALLFSQTLIWAVTARV